jgi:23S rRNA (guanine2445-N2)-methyltransferase / 23S rRNA (guanine2069-N7)-methyltransferase
MTQLSLFATTPKAMETILADELTTLGAKNLQATVAGVAFEGTLATAYRICLWSRTANRILLRLAEFELHSQQDLYDGVKKINWWAHLTADNSFKVTFKAKNSKVINNTHFGALKVKDAVVDLLREKYQQRPNIDKHRPDIHINVYLNGTHAQLSLDLSGESLHKRGYRAVNIEAPIKENLAAAILLRSDWSAIAAAGGSFLDPMCGSGTLVIEAAMIAADFAPGLLRKYYGFLGWQQHDATIWQQLIAEAHQRKTQGLEKMPPLIGFDHSKYAIATALKHIDNAGLRPFIHLEKRDINDCKPTKSRSTGLVACNPPYGERLGDDAEIRQLYQQLGHVLKDQFIDWTAAIIIFDPELGFRLGLRSHKPITFYNGALACKLLRFDINQAAFFTPKANNPVAKLAFASNPVQSVDHQHQAPMFANRLRKNIKKFNRWAKQQAIDCYRVYDADLPEYAVAIDLYHGEKLWVNVQEYAAPKSIDTDKSHQRLAAILVEIPKVLNIDSRQISLKIRRLQKNTDQYEKQASLGQFHVVNEGSCQLWVNFKDYLDTGLFLDHRPLRLKIADQARGKRFLNLFAYTGTASVHAAVGGATSTLTVDMSTTYLQWAKNNFALNQLQGQQYQFVQSDCVLWLAQAQQRLKKQFDLIFLDPPTFSNSKRLAQFFDIQLEHVTLIKQTVELLSDQGVLYFSTNSKRFKLDYQGLESFTIDDISTSTIPDDFSRSPKIHYCWRICQA